MFCDADGAARLEARGAGSDQRMERAFRLADFPGDAAPRALALAGVEMLAALDPAVRERIQIRQSPPPPAAAPPPRTAPPGRADAADSLAPVGIAISAVRRDFLGDGSAGGWGGRVELDRGLGGPFVLGVDAEIDGARTAVALGEARALILSAGAFGGLRASGARFAGSLAAGARVGLASLEGTPAGGSGATGGRALRPWWGPALAARGWIRAGARRVRGDAGGRGGRARRAGAGRRGHDPGGRRHLARRRDRRTILNRDVSWFSREPHQEGMTMSRTWLGLGLIGAALLFAACSSSQDSLLTTGGKGGSARGGAGGTGQQGGSGGRRWRRDGRRACLRDGGSACVLTGASPRAAGR